jgi:hypothetical protein
MAMGPRNYVFAATNKILTMKKAIKDQSQGKIGCCAKGIVVIECRNSTANVI